MGFLGFLKKKKEDSTGSQLELPLPPKAGEGEAELPSFPEQELVEDLRLPEIPELEQPVSESFEMPELPARESEQNEFEIKPEPREAPEPEMTQPELTMPEEPILHEDPEHESMEDAYKYTPAEPNVEDIEKAPEFPKKETEIASLGTGIRGEVFIRGDDYRNLIEGLEEFTRNEKEKNTKQEKDIFRAEEREHERFMKIVEDLQRSLILTENNIFE